MNLKNYIFLGVLFLINIIFPQKININLTNESALKKVIADIEVEIKFRFENLEAGVNEDFIECRKSSISSRVDEIDKSLDGECNRFHSTDLEIIKFFKKFKKVLDRETPLFDISEIKKIKNKVEKELDEVKKLSYNDRKSDQIIKSRINFLEKIFKGLDKIYN